jgi:hypothetical protein
MGTDGPSDRGMSLVFERVEQAAKARIILLRLSWVENSDSFLGDGRRQILPLGGEKVVRKDQVFWLNLNNEFEAG